MSAALGSHDWDSLEFLKRDPAHFLSRKAITEFRGGTHFGVTDDLPSQSRHALLGFHSGACKLPHPPCHPNPKTSSREKSLPQGLPHFSCVFGCSWDL